MERFITDPKAVLKAIASGIVTLSAYLIGVIPAEGGFGDVTTVQWLGGVVFLGLSYGITYSVPNVSPKPVVRDEFGRWRLWRNENGAVDLRDILLILAIIVVIVVLIRPL